MEMRNSALEKVAVKKVKHEVDTIIEEARIKLEEYVEDESELSLLAEVSNALVQVERTLQLVQINGAAVLAREMCDVVEGLMNEKIAQKDKAQECLSRGILQMSDYLEYVQAGNKDLPVVLLPLLNDLRGVREAPLLSEHILFFPDLDDIDVPNVEVSIDMPAREYAKKIRYGYQTGLVCLIQNKEIDIATTKMCKVAIRLHQCSTQTAARRLWWVCSAVTQALAIQGLVTSTGLASLLGQVDRQIKQFIDLDESAFAAQIPAGLIKNLLYYVGIAEKRGRIVSKVQQAYGLDDLIPTEMDIDQMREGLSGPNADVLDAVSKALHEDIETVKDSIELYVHSKNRSAESVTEVSKDLQKIADTLGMLGLDEPREDVLREVTALNGLSEDELEHADSNFIAVAETLIKAENIVDNFVNYRIQNKPAVELVADDGNTSEQSENAGQLRKIQVQTITEALSEIEEAKNTFSQVLTAPEDEDKYIKVQDHFRKVLGALSILNLEEASKILECVQAFLLDENAIQQLSSNSELLDAFADSLTSVECYLEALIVDEGNPKDILEYGVKNASKLIGNGLDLSGDAQPLETVEVKEFELEDDSLALQSADNLEVKKKSKITAQNTSVDKTADEIEDASSSQDADSHTRKAKPTLNDELDLEDLSATSLDLSLDFDLVDAPSNESNPEDRSEDMLDEDLSEDLVDPLADEAINISLDKEEDEITELLDLPDSDQEFSEELIELEATSIEATASDLEKLADEELDSHINLDMSSESEPIGVVEVDPDETNLLDLNEIQEELNTNAKAYKFDGDQLADIDGDVNEETPEESETFLTEVSSSIDLNEDIMEQLNDLAYEISVNVDGVQHTLSANRGEADPEVLEIFVEEAEEEIEKINLNREIWRSDEANEDALAIVRRSFHTLKGGGRLIGAEIIGEYAWQIENTLNKVIDKSIVVSSELHELLEISVALLKELVQQLKSDYVPQADVTSLFVSAQNFINKQYDLLASDDEADEEKVDDPIKTSIEVKNIDLEEVDEITPEHSQKTDQAENENFDQELFALFVEEAKQHINTIEEILETKQEHKILPVDEKLLHALHTLFGCSRTAKVTSITTIIDPLDEFCRECHLCEEKIKAAQFDVFVECIAYVKQAIEQTPENLLQSDVNANLLEKVNSLNGVEIPTLDDVVSENLQSSEVIENESLVNDAHEETDQVLDHEPEHELEKTQRITLSDSKISPAELPENVDVFEGKDADLVEIFLEEANDILITCNECLEKWHTNHKNENAVLEFRRQLHTLKGSARMAAYSNIGDLSHEFESLIIAISESRLEANESVFNLSQRCLDHLNDMVDQAVEKHPIFPAENLIAEITAFQSGQPYVPEEHLISPARNIQDEQEKASNKVQQVKASDSEPEKVVKIPVLRDPVDPNETAITRPVIAAQQAVRLQSNVLDNLVNNAGEVNIFQARLEQVSNTYSININELEQVVARLRDQLRNLEIETETQILSRHAHEVPEQDDFDPLELDRYSNIQQLSRSLAESVNDLLSIKDILADQVHESEILLTQQRRISGDLQEGLMRTRMVQFNQLVPRLQRIVRQTSRELDKQADLKVVGQNTEVDSSILNRIIAPLEHLVRNAISHGIEDAAHREKANKDKQGEIKIAVVREGAEIILEVSDDGAGLNVEKIKAKAMELGLINNLDMPNREALSLILMPGFSTASQVSQVSGRGVGMDVVAHELKQLGGSLQIDSEEGAGATFTIRIPFTLAITQSLLVKCANEIYAVPLASVEGVVRLSAHELKQKYAEQTATYHYADRDYRLCHLGSLLSVCKPQLDGADKMFPVLLVRSGDSRMAIHVEATLGNREIVVKPLAAQLSRLPVVSGATILGDGNVVLILDVPGLIRMDAAHKLENVTPRYDSTIIDSQPTVMVVDDSITIRKVTTRFLERNNYKVTTAKDGVDAVQKLQDFTPALILLDIEMPRMDGYELASHVRNNERLKNVPIIMITSRTGDKHRQRAMDIGVQEYLGKPYNESELLSYVQEIIK
ncbi:MAG: response regulator [Pseudomonadota bacterium]